MPRPALLPLLILVAAAGAFAQAGHVVVIGIDGFGAQAIRDNPVPAIRALMASGSWTLRARGVMPTVSSPNWASMIMGAGPEQHGVLSNEWQPDRFEFSPVCRGMAATFPTIFGLLRQPYYILGLIESSRYPIFADSYVSDLCAPLRIVSTGWIDWVCGA